MENSKLITLTDEAAVAVKELLEQQQLPDHSLRIYIAGVG